MGCLVMEKNLVITKDNLSEYRAIEIFMENVEGYEIEISDVLDIYINCDKRLGGNNEYFSSEGYIKFSSKVKNHLTKGTSSFDGEDSIGLNEDDYKFGNRISRYLDICSITLLSYNKKKLHISIPYYPVESVHGGIIEFSDCHSFEFDESGNILIKYGKMSNMPKKENLFFEDIVDNWKNILPEFKSSCARFYTGKYYYKEIDGEITVSIVGNLEYKNGKDYDVRLVFENVSDYEEDIAEEITYIEIFKLASGEYFAQIGYVSEFKFERCYVEKIYL